MPSAIVKKRRATKRADQDGEPEFQVAPMVDVLLVLLLFFMSITSTELLKKERNLHLADANQAKKDENKPQTHQVIINVTWDGLNNIAGFIMDGVSYAKADDFTAILSKRLAQDPRLYVLLRADRDVQYSNISDLMAACAQAGIGTVTFSVLIGTDTDKPPSGDSGAGTKTTSN